MMQPAFFEPRKVGEIAHIQLYPVKSCGGIELEEAKLTLRGLETLSPVMPVKDREYMIVDARPEMSTHHHKFLTQRDRGLQKMALITPALRGEHLLIRWDHQDGVELRAAKGKELPIRVHHDFTIGVDQGEEVAQLLSDYLERSVRLVRAAGGFHRVASQQYIENPNTLSWQDAYSVNWLFQESVYQLRTLLKSNISYHSFRPNIVGVGGTPNLEHTLFRVRFGSVEGIQPKPSSRCMIVNVNPQEGAMSTEKKPLPLQTIFDHMNWRDKNGKEQAIFAENFLPSMEGRIRQHDAIIALSARSPPLEYGKRATSENGENQASRQ